MLIGVGDWNCEAFVSVAVLCNLSDGLIIGVDSAVTVSDANGIRKVFEDGEKLFQLADKIGVAAYGLGGLEGRSIGSFVHEFELANPDIENVPIRDVVERLRAFFMDVYIRFGEDFFGVPFDQIPVEKKGNPGADRRRFFSARVFVRGLGDSNSTPCACGLGTSNLWPGRVPSRMVRNLRSN